MASSTISNVSTTTTPSAVSSSSTSESKALSTEQIAIVIGSVSVGLLILLSLVFVSYLRRSRHQKLAQSELESKCVDGGESQETFMLKPSKHSMYKRAEADSFITSNSESQYLKDAYSRPTSSVRTYYTGLPTHEAHSLSLDITRSPKDNVETAPLRSELPSSSKPTIKLAPLTIPGKIPSNSNRNRTIKGTISRKLTKPFDSGWDSDDSASLYSVASATASASASAHFSKPPQETIMPPPVPPFPVHFASPAQSTLPRGTGITLVTPTPYEEETTTNLLPPLRSITPLSLSLNRDDGEEDETQIYNVAKLLQSRQGNSLMVPEDAVSRNASVVSHIEREGSISVVITPTNEKPYRPRYYRLKQKRDKKDPFSSNLSTQIDIRDSSSTFSTTTNSIAPQLRS